jgi:DUF1680 family protein
MPDVPVQVPSMAQAQVTGGFWGRMASLHRESALEHQWSQLVATGAVECFEVVAGRRPDGFVSRDFTSDSDLHKWLDAVGRVPVAERPPAVRAAFDEAVGLVAAAQEPDGYCNTWIQAFFADGRWRDLETEHEQYTLGHLVEAAVSAHEATGDERLLVVATRAADLLVARFAGAPAAEAVGHEGVEIALVRLARSTGDPRYLDLAAQLVDQRGTAAGVRRRFVATLVRTGRRLARQRRARRAHERAVPGWRRPERVPGLQVRITPAVAARTAATFVSGRWAQTDRPARSRTEPTGHAVCFQYLHTAMAMVARDRGDEALADVTVAAWERAVAGHLFANGGLGAYPGLEGFGAPFDLDPERAYSETCASIAGVLWNRELGLLTGAARHDELLEWQLLNGVAVGTALDGRGYHYNNPLQVAAGFGRRPWYPIPCCPSNLSRTWASVATLATSRVGDELRVHQYVSSRSAIGGAEVEIDSELPWAGEVAIGLGGDRPAQRLAFRVPGWAGSTAVAVDGVEVAPQFDEAEPLGPTASGLDPGRARWGRIDLPGGPCRVRLSFGLPVRFPAQDGRVPRVGGRVAVARGPLLYCLEGVDHPDRPGRDLFEVTLDRASLVERWDPDLLGGVVVLDGTDGDGRPLRFVPYFAWGNRGATGMTCFVR